jgi:hypothetical protein
MARRTGPLRGRAPALARDRTPTRGHDFSGDRKDDLLAITPRRGTAPTGANYTVHRATGSAFACAGAWASSDDVSIDPVDG